MKQECPVCGKSFWVDWPNLWVFKRDRMFICSYSCANEYDRRKEAKNMGRQRKDGTPARKPVKKAPEEPKVELVYDQSIAEEYRREQAQKEANERAKAEELKLQPGGNYKLSVEEKQDTRFLFRTAAVRNEILGVFYYDEKYNTVDWRHPEGEEISMPPCDWNLLAQSLGQIMHALGVEHQEMEV